MSIDPDGLLDLARELAGTGRGRPPDVNLRRGVSTAYYALFHDITALAVEHVLRKGAHVTVQDEIHARGVECYVGKPQLREASQLIGERVTVVGHVCRDYLGRPVRVGNARVEAVPEPRRVSVAEMGGALQGGPDSVKWLRDQRGD